MDITTLIGIVVAFCLVGVSILMGGPGGWFINYPSIMIVMGGTIGATLINYPLSEVLSVLKVTKNVFMHKSQPYNKLIPLIVDFSKMARREGILSFDTHLKDIKDPFLAKAFRMSVDGMDIDVKWFNFNGHSAKSNYTESEVSNERETKTSKLH